MAAKLEKLLRSLNYVLAGTGYNLIIFKNYFNNFIILVVTQILLDGSEVSRHRCGNMGLRHPTLRCRGHSGDNMGLRHPTLGIRVLTLYVMHIILVMYTL